jgi:hypothetical protein
MDQPSTPVSPQTPQAPTNQKRVTQGLPHLVVDEPKRGIFGTLGIIVLSLMLLGIPIGIFLVSQRTDVTPEAAVEEKLPEVISGIFLESKLSLESSGGIIPVDVYVKSPIDQINLVNAQISFNPSFITVDKIATGAAELNLPQVFNKWIEVHSDNTKGRISIISGLPNPGLRTGSGGEKAYLATLYLKPVAKGTAVLQVTPDSLILRNSDNNNIFKTGNDLALSLTDVITEATSSASPKPAGKDEKLKEEPLLVITSPLTAANYSYFKPIEINWSSFNVDMISQINLYINNDLLGPIAQNLQAEEGQYSWQPKETLALPYIQLTNIFRIELIGISKDGAVAKTISAPFGILGTEEVTGTSPNPEAFSKNQLTVLDASRALSNYLVLPLKDKSLDLNKDEAINELDLFLIRQNLLMRGVVR